MIGSYTTQYIVNLTKIMELKLNNLTQENVLNLTQMYCLHAYVYMYTLIKKMHTLIYSIFYFETVHRIDWFTFWHTWKLKIIKYYLTHTVKSIISNLT